MMDESQVIVVPQPEPPKPELTKGEFRALLTLNEQKMIDNFNFSEWAVTKPAIQALTVDERATVRTALATYKDVTGVSLTDKRTVIFVGMLAQFNLLDGPERYARILSGQLPE